MRLPLTWTIEADGHLSVTLANGESGRLFQSGAFEITATSCRPLISLTAPLFPGEDTLVHVVRLSFDKVAATVPTTQAGLAGIYTGTFAYDFADPLDGDLDYIDDLSARLNPDGTGSFEGYFFNEALLSRLSTVLILAGSAGKLMGMVMCRLTESIDLTDFIFLLLRVSVGSVEPTVSDCLSITEIDILSRVFSNNLARRWQCV